MTVLGTPVEQPTHGDARSSPAPAQWLSEAEIALFGLESSPSRQRDYLPQDLWVRICRPSFSRPESRLLLDNKWVFSRTMASYGLPTPRTYGLYDPRHGVTDRLEPLRTADDVARLSSRVGETGMVAKPVNGLKGIGIVVVRAVDRSGSDPKFVLADGAVMSADDLVARFTRRVRRVRGFVLQERCLPHPWASGVIRGPMVLRLVVLSPPVGDPIIQMAALFAGKAGNDIWSWEDRGVTIGVDLTTGTLGLGRTLPQFSTDWLTHHPDTGARFTGLVVPFWNQVRDLVTKAARATPGVRLAAWEVLVTPDGPRLLEGNLGFGTHTLQVHTDGFLTAGGMAEAWHETSPRFTRLLESARSAGSATSAEPADQGATRRLAHRLRARLKA